jgi:hypothetical protein
MYRFHLGLVHRRTRVMILSLPNQAMRIKPQPQDELERDEQEMTPATEMASGYTRSLEYEGEEVILLMLFLARFPTPVHSGLLLNLLFLLHVRYKQYNHWPAIPDLARA